MDMSGIAAISGADVADFMSDLFGESEIRQIGDTTYMRYPVLKSIDISSPPADEITSAEDLVVFDPGLFDA